MKPVTGNTFPIKDQLKKLGGRWDAESKCWMVPEDKIREAQRLADSVPAPERMEGKKAAGTKKCAGCGVSHRRRSRAQLRRMGRSLPV